VVEDNPVNQRLMRRYLGHLGHEVVVVEDGLHALERMEGTRDDLVLLDVHLPGLDGLEVVRRARRAGYDAPVIAVTALAMRGDRRRILDAGCDGYLAKPFHLEELAGILREYLEDRPRRPPERRAP